MGFLQLLVLQVLLVRQFDQLQDAEFDHQLLRRHLDRAIDHLLHLDILLQENKILRFQLLLLNLLNLPVPQFHPMGLRHHNRHLMPRLVMMLQNQKLDRLNQVIRLRLQTRRHLL